MDFEEVKRVIKQAGVAVLPPGQYRLGIFGSRAVGRPGKFSDVDVAVLGPGKLSAVLLDRFQESLENSDLPYFVDVVDLNSTSETFRNQVQREAIWL
jgi:predicted nucleotidyltransferase